MKLSFCTTALAAVCLLGLLADPAAAIVVGPGASITDAINQDTPGGDRLNVDRSATMTLLAGTYDLTAWRINVFSHTEPGTITPMLLSGTPGSYTTLWVGAPFDPTINGIQSVPASGSITVASPTAVYAGFFTQGGGAGIIALDADNSGSGDSLTDHDNLFSIPAGPGEAVTGFSNPALGRTYAFGVYVTNHTIRFLPITGDADSGISNTKTYTHALDFGSGSPAALVNGVQFQTGNPGFGAPTASTTVGTGSHNLPNSHGGNAAADAVLAAGGVRELVRDMTYGAASGLGVITLTGLTPGTPYEVRLYNRQWGAGVRDQTIGFNTDGVGTNIAGAENVASFNEDDASAPDPAFATATQVNALTYQYTLAPGVTTLTIYVNSVVAASSYHLYGLTNEVAVAPVAVGLTPADEAVGVNLGNDLKVTFNDPVLLGSGNITLKNLDLATDTVITVPDSQVSVNGVVMTIDPATTLEPFTNYAIQIAPGVITDIYGQPYAGIADNVTWNFTTGAPEAIPPLATAFSPADGAVDVGRGTPLVITFDEPVKKGTGNIVIKRTSDNSVVDTIDAASGSVAISGAVANITPHLYLSSKTGYYIEIDPGAIKDLVGNNFAGISGSSAWNFETTHIYFVPITGDADSGIDIGKSYTHAIDFGNNITRPIATVNGVAFVGGGPGSFPDSTGTAGTIGTGTSNIPSSHDGNDAAAAVLTGTGMRALVGDMLYNAANTQITLTGLTPGTPYQFRLFHRRWDGSGTNRSQSIAIDTNGVAGAESTAVFNEDNATRPDPGFATDTQVYALTYDYVLAPLVTTLTININQTGTGTYHLYGLTNEVVDSIAPLVTAKIPADEDTGVITYDNLDITFNDQMLIGSGNIRVKNLDLATEIVIAVPDPRVSVAGDTVTINPDFTLIGNTRYAIRIDPGTFTDSSGNPFAGISDDVTWNFQTGVADLTNPLATTFIPADNETGVNPTSDLVISFNETMVKGTGNIVIRESVGGAVLETIPVSSGNVTIFDTEVTINPTANLASNSSYYVEIDGTALTDLNGNAAAGISGSSAWNFTTRGALVLRLRAADFDGVTGVWTDSSGLGNHATAPTPAETPALITGQTSNGSSIVRFDGGDGLALSTGITPLSTAAGYTAFAYLRPEAANTKSIFAGTSGCFQYRITPGPGLKQNIVRQEQLETGTGVTSLLAGTASGFSNINAQVNGSGVGFRLNGSADGGSAIASTYSAPISTIGARLASAEIFIGDIAEIRIYDRQLTPLEIAAVEAELEAAYSSTYGTWAGGYVPADVTDKNGNIDGDLLVNLLEFGFGTDPTLWDSGPLNWDGVTLNNRGAPTTRFGVTTDALFMRRIDHDTPGSVSYAVEFTADLADWETSAATPTVLATDGDYELVSVPYTALLGNGKPARFFRVRVTSP